MKVLIVDDEPAARRRLVWMLEELDEEIVGEAADGESALAAIARTTPDVVLLDVRMRGLSGIEVARALREPRPLLIFQTAFDAYAVQAFEDAAVDYLLKPFSLSRLRLALDRARMRLGSARPAFGDDMLARLQSVLEERARGPATSPGTASRVLVRDRGGHAIVPLDDIVSFILKDRVVYALTASGQRATDYTLQNLEQRFGALVLRANRSEVVTVDAVQRFVGNGDGSATLHLRDGRNVIVSRRRASVVRRALRGD